MSAKFRRYERPRYDGASYSEAQDIVAASQYISPPFPEGHKVRDDMSDAIAILRAQLDGLLAAGQGGLASPLAESLGDIGNVSIAAGARATRLDEVIEAYNQTLAQNEELGREVSNLNTRISELLDSQRRAESLLHDGQWHVLYIEALFDAIKAEAKLGKVPRGFLGRIQKAAQAVVDARDSVGQL